MPKIQKKTKSSNVLKFSFTETLKLPNAACNVMIFRVTGSVDVNVSSLAPKNKQTNNDISYFV